MNFVVAADECAQLFLHEDPLHVKTAIFSLSAFQSCISVW